MKTQPKRRRPSLRQAALKVFIWIFLAIFIFSAVGVAFVTSR